MKTRIKNEVVEILKEQLKIEGEIEETADLFNDLGVDSTGIIELLLALEERCEVEFDMEELDPEVLSTVETLSNYIVSLQE
ncbi:acyl carrier protein [Priestia koreensis]|uniref:acyl carrier protein n=1 Tax=Priestia koreensis TaxID=284581 RepID=UPI003CFCD2F7